MPTFTETAKATKKKREVKLVGIDMYIITEEGIPKFDEYAQAIVDKMHAKA